MSKILDKILSKFPESEHEHVREYYKKNAWYAIEGNHPILQYVSEIVQDIDLASRRLELTEMGYELKIERV